MQSETENLFGLDVAPKFTIYSSSLKKLNSVKISI